MTSALLVCLKFSSCQKRCKSALIHENIPVPDIFIYKVMRHTRIKLPAPAAYHITSRIKGDEFLLEDDADKRDLLDIIRRAAVFAGITVMSYTILDNHFHLLIHIPERQEVGDAELERRARILWGDEKAEERFECWRFWESHGKAQRAENERNALRRRMYDISPFVKTIKDTFRHSYKRRHGVSGAVWGRTRFKSAAVASDFKTLATVATYIDLNAVRARVARHPKRYKWCCLGAANKGDRFAIEGLDALAAYRAAQAGAANTEARMAANETAFDVYLRFVDGTNNSGDRFSSGRSDSRSLSGAGGRDSSENDGAVRNGYVRKTLDSADLTRLGATGVARWLEESEIKPECLSEMWSRRFGNFVVGGIIGPLAVVITVRETLARGAGVCNRWQPSVVEEIYTFIHERNVRARKRNAV